MRRNSEVNMSYSDWLRGQRKHRTFRRRTAVVAIATGLALPLILTFFHPMGHASAPAPKVLSAQTQTPAEGQAQSSSTTNQVPGATQPITTSKVNAPRLAAGSSTPDCQKSSGFADPIADKAVASRQGLSETPTVIHQYQINGNSIASINAQIYRCTPVVTSEGHFAGSTQYAISWAYTYTQNDNGFCSIDNANVTLATSQILPYWLASAGTANATRTKWQNFRAHLVEHENGHVALARQYANNILRDIQTSNNLDCDNLTQVVDGRIQSNLRALASANIDYDSSTSHGSTQGAKLDI